MSAEKDYLNWRRQPAVGCMFARFLATRHADDPQQRLEVVPIGKGPVKAAADVAERIERMVSDPAITAATLLFPAVATLEDLALIMLGMGAHPHWGISTGYLQPPPNLAMVTVHMARQIPFGDKTCPSEVLVLGPYKEFPPTRLAPMAAMEMYVGQPLTHDPKDGSPTVKANLAHMDHGLPTQKAIDNMWDKSSEGRKKSLGGQDNRAKAKVSFVIPPSLARKLGCLPP